MGGEFQNGLCGCFNDCGLCVITYFVPCYTFGKNAEAVGQSCVLCGLGMFFGFAICLGPFIRGKIREKQGIDGSCCGDVLTWWFCSFCALMQEAQEVKGLSPSGAAIERE
ncbi:hypothetical protein BOX15_Mlig033169g1 [Macrostomum lignano]|uniref:Uncharacterized protein n=1 Tax=Macrostomum lignano TaxID=282301 RepID=A0A267E7X8_9PLAT|nr:hypothetical protein BOX15_Mlig033169g3 [Macrostomum lignano]PAA57691.1 hypothetical protein BOX15_Mlig033169g2 [Macrostomum lignano]PAA65440.1 hypothetical protein BOX15_Mlig033169g1 [Macrostomum lignano]